jgi:hypothetical protein
MVDLFKVPEDERIVIVADRVLAGGRIAILLEDEKLAPGKIERYIGRIRALVPGVKVDIAAGPVANVSTVTFKS